MLGFEVKIIWELETGDWRLFLKVDLLMELKML